MEGPGEWFGLIQAGPHRGIPAIHLQTTRDMMAERDLPRLIEDVLGSNGLASVGKAFIVVKRYLTSGFIAQLREWGAYLVADGASKENHEWFKQCNHWTVRMVEHDWLLRKADSIIYQPEIDLSIPEPGVGDLNTLTPKYLLVEDVNQHVVDFLMNSQYAWGVQPLGEPLLGKWYDDLRGRKADEVQGLPEREEHGNPLQEAGLDT